MLLGDSARQPCLAETEKKKKKKKSYLQLSIMGLRALSDKHLLFKFHTKASARERKQSARSRGTPSSAEKVLLLLDKSLGLLLSPTPNTHMQDLTALIATHTHTPGCVFCYKCNDINLLFGFHR